MRKREAGAGDGLGDLLFQLRHIEVLEDVPLGLIGQGNRIGLEIEGERDGLGVGSQIYGVFLGDEREGGFPGGEAEHGVLDGADGEVGVREGRQVARVLHGDFFQGEFYGIGVEQEAFVHQSFSEAVVHFYAARSQEGCRQTQC